MQKFKWGILGCGKIADQMAEELAMLEDAELIACGSRTGRENGFAAKHKIPKRYSDYTSLLDDPAVDVVYIANTHNFHYESMMLALNHGKHVLCEKPFTINAAQAEEVIELARSKKLFLMEAMWTRFIPAIVKLREWLQDGRIGDVLKVSADFCIPLDRDPKKRWTNPELGGSALLDLGVYPVSFASMVFGKTPSQIESSAYLGKTGVDESSEYRFRYDGVQSAQLSSSFCFFGPNGAFISGSEGWIHIPDHFHRAQKLLRGEGETLLEEVFLPFDGKGLRFEASEVMRCIHEGLTESPVMPLDETLEIMRTMDTMRAQWGLVYPEEK